MVNMVEMYCIITTIGYLMLVKYFTTVMDMVRIIVRSNIFYYNGKYGCNTFYYYYHWIFNGSKICLLQWWIRLKVIIVVKYFTIMVNMVVIYSIIITIGYLMVVKLFYYNDGYD